MSDNLTRDEARVRAELVGDVRYDVDLDLTGGDDTFLSTTAVHFTSARVGASTFLDLDAAQVEHVEHNGRPLPADAVDPVACRIQLNDLAATNTVVVRARCRYQTTGVGLHRFVDPVDDKLYLHTQFEPFDAHRVFACFDQPDVKAPFALTVTAPPDWTVVSNGEVVERREHGDAATTRFATTPRMSTYITALVAGPFAVVRDTHHSGGNALDLGLYCRQSLAQHLDADELFTITKQGFDFFTRVFDQPYPFGSKYDQLFVPEFNAGAMENVGCVTFSESYVFRSKVTDAARQARASTITHEMAHMWFGNLVTMRWWDDLWLNESFATYVGTLALAEATRFTDAWADFASSMKAWALAQDQLPSTHPIKADIVDTDAVRTNFDGITYAKGAAVLKQLVAWVGQEEFLAGCRDYFARHAYANAELTDFLAALERASGRDLEAWSRQWLETAGPNTLRPAIRIADDGTYAEVVIEQSAPPEYPTLRDHRVAVGLYDRTADSGRLTRRQRLELDVTGERTPVKELVGEPVADLLLVNDDDLTFAKLRLDARSVDTMVSSLSALHEPLARALCWSAAWDMVRDAELPARRFVELVARHAEGETDIGNLQTLLRQASAAIDRYGAPNNRDRARAQLAAAARAGMEAAEPGSDRQLAWARCLIANARSQQDLDWAEGLLAGTVKVPGLTVDTELRWQLVTALAAAGRLGEPEIAAEHRRDNTDMGARRAAAARAARPTAEAKAEAWRLVVDDPAPSLTMRRAVLGGLHQHDQEALLEPYVARYPEALAAAWQGRGIEESLLLTSGLFPEAVVSPEVLAMADQVLASDDLPAPAYRLVSEARDQCARALRARAADEAASEPR